MKRSALAILLAALAVVWLATPASLTAGPGDDGDNRLCSTAATLPASLLAAPADDDDDEPKDYWKEVKFDRLRFQEILEFVRLHYIDNSYDKGFALQRAANYALATVDEHLELLPQTFYQQRRKLEEEKTRLAGKVRRVAKGDSFLVLEHVEDWRNQDRKRMDDDEIRAERERRKARYAALKAAWASDGFTRRDFERVMRFALKEADTHKKRADDLWIAAAQGYLAALDPHSSMVSKKAWKENTDEIRDASFEGIGALLTQRYEDIVVESPIEGQPAAKAGLRAGDVIVKVDTTDVRGMPLQKVVKLIRGPKATKVVLTVQRVGVPEDLAVPITRSYIAIKNITPRLLGPEHPELGYVKVRGFIPGTTSELRNAIEELARQSPTGRLSGLVLDMRGNSGGLLQEAVRMSDLFLAGGRVVSVRSRNAEDEIYEADKGGEIALPLAVLVNDGTASAAEIVANAVQENRRGLVMGDRTFGKATVQSLLPPVLGSGYFVKLTIARYYGPLGNTLQVRGVVPDVSVAPGVGEEMPLGFREEDLYDHLPHVAGKAPLINKAQVELLAPCVERGGLAERMHAANPNPAIKFDYQLYKAADWLECMVTRVAARGDKEAAQP